MSFLFDTDHISILQRGPRLELSKIKARIASYLVRDFACSIVSFDEQTRGACARINGGEKARGTPPRLRIARIALERLRHDDRPPVRSGRGRYVRPPLLAGSPDRDDGPADRLDRPARGLILLTRNAKDFGKVPGLVIEDWTV